MINEEQISNLLNQFEMQFRNMTDNIGYEYTRPSFMHKLIPFKDGNKWCALLGDNLQNGIVGFGDNPTQAMTNFDIEYLGNNK